MVRHLRLPFLSLTLCAVGISLLGLGTALQVQASTGQASNPALNLSGAWLDNDCTVQRATSRPPNFETPAVNPIIYDPIRKLVYAADIANNQIAVIDPATDTVIRNIPVGLGPAALTLAPDPTGE